MKSLYQDAPEFDDEFDPEIEDDVEYVPNDLLDEFLEECYAQALEQKSLGLYPWDDLDEIF